MTASAPRALVARTLARLRRRALTLALLRRGAAALGAGALTFVAAASAVGPATTTPAAALSWLAVLGAVAAGWSLGGQGDVPTRGPRAARLLDATDPALAAALRSAAELAELPGHRLHAPDLVDAHARGVARRLVSVDPRRALPWRALLRPPAVAGAAAAVAALAWYAAFDAPPAGAYALTHPRARADDAVLGAVVSGLTAELVFPAHLDRPPSTLEGPTVVEAPRGTTVRLRATLRVDAREAVADAAGARIPLTVDDDGVATGSFVLREDGALRLRVRDAHARWLEDATRRRLRAVPDAAPTAVLREPSEDRVVEASEEVVVDFEVSDDVGVVDVDLVVEGPRGESRRRLLHYPEHQGVPAASSATRVVPAELGARPGDRLVLWIEARDGDRVMGPNVGRSVRRTLTVASEATRRTESLAALGALLDLALDALADRLEAPPPQDPGPAAARFETVAASTRALLDGWDALEDAEARALADRAADRAALDTAFRREAALHRPTPGPAPRRAGADAAVVEALEDTALALADAVSTARLGDVASLARELEGLRREIASLLEELRRGGGEATRQALREAIARAEQRMAQIAERLAAMQENVPSEFLNADALERQQAESMLAALRDAVDGDDLDEAERRLAELERAIDSLASGLSAQRDAFAEERAGPRQRAMSELMDALTGLEDEQRGLAGDSAERARQAGDRALEAARDQGGQEGLDELAERADGLRRALDGIDGDAIPSFDRELLEGARSRLADARDALSAGDLGEAREMMRGAVRSARDLARDLDLGARMFPGQDGSDVERAEEARRAAADAEALARDVERAVPRVDRFVTPEDRRRLRDDAGRQRRARGRLDDVRRQLGEEGALPELGPVAEGDLRGAEDAMREAEGALEGADPVGANRAQERALERLRELRERLEGETGGGAGARAGGDGQGEGGDGGGWARSREPVEIPGGEGFQGPAELRRRVLDAMRERPPEDWQPAVDRYYQELLR